ncbi:hypothetical protein [Carboxylicivirga marina]|uniref:Uncharacterized protein n=1 Tax=Carboxylicivirga marina TaxID=2800988 RepID=A0ABS1HQU7_9BACT|nr:hypothetical protein [Carboxylicivirga marina]MBK3519922.1 hypothetical protein [Carboxylicivirga marina]
MDYAVFLDELEKALLPKPKSSQIPFWFSLTAFSMVGAQKTPCFFYNRIPIA